MPPGWKGPQGSPNASRDGPSWKSFCHPHCFPPYCSRTTALLRSELRLHSPVPTLEGKEAEEHQAQSTCNPWGLHCHQAHLTRLCSEYQENKLQRILSCLPPSWVPLGGEVG